MSSTTIPLPRPQTATARLDHAGQRRIAPDPAPAPVAVRDRRWAVLGVLCLSMFIAVMDDTIMNVTLPSLVRQLGATTTDLQWIVDAFALVFAGLLLAAGSLGDRFGRKHALSIGLVLFAGCSALGANASSTRELIASRAAMGVGAALIFPATLAILANVFTDRRERAKAIGIWSAVTGAAIALGPITGGFLLEHFWWGSVLLINVPICAVALVLGWWLVPNSRDPRAPRLDKVGFGLSIVGVSTLVFTVIEAPREGWLSPRSAMGFLLALAATAAFVAWERHVDEPMLDMSVFASRRFSAASASITVAFFALFGFIFMVAQYLQFVKGYDALGAGIRTLPFAIAAGVCGPLGVKAAQRVGSKVVVAGGLTFMGCGFVLDARLGAASPYWSIAVAMVILAGGLGLVMTPATEAIMGALPIEKAGVGSAVNDTTRQLGGTLGVAVIGSVFASSFGRTMTSALAHLPMPAPAMTVAKSSIGGAYQIADLAPAGAGSLIRHAASQSFMAGFARGSVVSAAVAFTGALLTFVFLPSRETDV